MKRVIVLADRSAMALLKFVVAANLLLFLSFALVVAFATTKVRAEAAACTGVDMLAALATSDPVLLAKVEAEAAAQENGRGLLWKIEKPGIAASYLFGTMHVADPRVTTLPPVVQKAYDASGTVVLETMEVLDQSRMLASIMQKPELMMFTDATTLASLIPPAEVDGVNKALEARGIPPYSVAKMKPWILSAMIAMPACELQRRADGVPVLDVKLGQDAEAKGKALKGLETAVEQLEAMASMPMRFHIEGLVETLKLGDRMDDVIETMVILYTRGDVGMFWPVFRNVLPSEGTDVAAGYAAFEQTMITARNKTMAERAGPILDAGGAFIAVGALHLSGPEGLVSLLREAGYTVTRADRG